MGLIKKIFYKLLHIVTLGKGIRKTFEGNTVRMPTRYFRYFQATYEQDNFKFINGHVKESMIVFDVGAHIGLMATVFGQKVGKNGKVYAFEPTPTTVGILHTTIKLNHADNVSIQPCALADQKGKLTFYISDNLADNSNSLVNNHRTDRKESSVDVEVNTIDSFVKEKNIAKIDFIKVDVEGAELRLLKGGQHTIRNYKPKMILAIHPGSIKNFGDSTSEIWDLLTDFGYKIMLGSVEIDKNEFTSRNDLFDVFLT